MTTNKETPTAGPLEGLLLAIELARCNAEPVSSNNEDGPQIYAVGACDWLTIVECASCIATPIVNAQTDNPTRYIVDEDSTPPSPKT